MKRLNKYLIIITAIILTISIVINVNANVKTDTTEFNDKYTLEEAIHNLNNKIETTLINFENITTDIIDKNIDLSNLNSNDYGITFTSDINNKFNNTSVLNDIYFSDITEVEAYYIIPENTSSRDLVIMVDTRIVNEKGLELLVVFEYHINVENRVYGMNLWVY